MIKSKLMRETLKCVSVTIDIPISIVTSLTFDIITNKQLFINHSLNSFNKAFIFYSHPE